jgi:hypothetical protein
VPAWALRDTLGQVHMRADVPDVWEHTSVSMSTTPHTRTSACARGRPGRVGTHHMCVHDVTSL